MKKYTSFKDSNLEWLREIPSHWKLLKSKYLFDNLDSKRIPLSSEERGLMENKIYDYYGASGVIDKVEDYIFDEPLILIGEDGANLYSRSTQLAFVAQGKYWVNNHAHILKPKTGELNYWVNLLEMIDYTIYITGSAQPKLTQDALANIVLPVPPNEEQVIIWNYLRPKLRGIDKLLSLMRNFITTLEQQRQSIIKEAVTKGLNPNVKIKDSGIGWIGEIPEHWYVAPLKYLASQEKNSFVDGPFGSDLKNEEYVDEGVPVIQLNNIKNGLLRLTNINHITKEKAEVLSRHTAYPGDLVIAKMASPIARSAVVPDFFDKYIIVADCIKLKLKADYYNEFVNYAMNTPFVIAQAESFANGTTRSRVNLGIIKNLKIAIPSIEEQIMIVQYLKNELSKLDQVLNSVKVQIQQLKEYRQSLIYEAVTGKIDVRDMELD